MRAKRYSQVKARFESFERGWNIYEGTPCAEGHTLRYVKTYCCVECQMAKARIRRAAQRASTQGSSSNPAFTAALSCLLGISE